MSDFSESFDKIADDYDRYRTGYLAEVFQDIIKIANLKDKANICEIGSGTGKATISFAKLGYNVTCIEPGEALLARAKENLSAYPLVQFQNETFEDSNLKESSFDLVFGAQSFHWLTPDIRYLKIAKILKAGGATACFWKHAMPSQTPLQREIDKVFVELLPDYQPDTLEQYERNIYSILSELIESNLFEQCQLRRYKEPLGTISCEEYVGELSTWSRVAVLSSVARTEFCQRVKSVVSSYGGNVPTDRYETALVCGIKRAAQT